MNKQKPPGVSWESFVERQIREAQDEGKFDNLPGFGKPLPDLGDPDDELWWVKKLAKRDNLSLLPPTLAIRVDVAKTLSGLKTMTSESQVRQALEALNERIRRANFAVVSGPPSTTMPLNIDEVVVDWRKDRPQS